MALPGRLEQGSACVSPVDRFLWRMVQLRSSGAGRLVERVSLPIDVMATATAQTTTIAPVRHSIAQVAPRIASRCGNIARVPCVAQEHGGITPPYPQGGGGR